MSIVKSKTKCFAPWYSFTHRRLEHHNGPFVMSPVTVDDYDSLVFDVSYNLTSGADVGGLTHGQANRYLKKHPKRDEIVELTAPCGDSQYYRKQDVVAFAKAILEAEGWTFQE